MKGNFQSTFVLILLLFLATGCAVQQNQGKLVRSMEVDKLVESTTVLPDHVYYFTGPQAEPDAIIAIKDNYTLLSKYWIKVDDVEKHLKDWNRFIDNSTRFRYPFAGAWILNQAGQQVGIWYSQYEHTVVRFPDASSVIIYKPLYPVETKKFHLNFFRSP